MCKVSHPVEFLLSKGLCIFEKQKAPWSRHFNFFSSTIFRGYNAGHRRKKMASVNALHQVMPSWLRRSRALSSGTPHPSCTLTQPIFTNGKETHERGRNSFYEKTHYTNYSKRLQNHTQSLDFTFCGSGAKYLGKWSLFFCVSENRGKKKRSTIIEILPAQARADPVSSIDRSKAKLLGCGHLAKTTLVSCKDHGRKEWRKVSSLCHTRRKHKWKVVVKKVGRNGRRNQAENRIPNVAGHSCVKEVGFVREAGIIWALGRATNPTCCPGGTNVGKL